MGAIIKKELRSYYSSPVAYIATIFFLVFSSTWFFYLQRFFAQDIASLRGYFGVMPLIYVILVPAITMRIWAEERKMGTAEVLRTLPYTEVQLVVGKYVAAMILLTATIVLTVIVPISVAPFGDFDHGKTAANYIGLLLLGSAAVGIGVFVSVLSRNQISAFILTALILLFFTLVSQIPASLDLSPRAAAIINYFSLDHHFQGFVTGVLDSRDVLFYLLVTALGLYGASRALLFRKWR